MPGRINPADPEGGLVRLSEVRDARAEIFDLFGELDIRPARSRIGKIIDRGVEQPGSSSGS